MYIRVPYFVDVRVAVVRIPAPAVGDHPVVVVDNATHTWT